jgi:hypothetical protein
VAKIYPITFFTFAAALWLWPGLRPLTFTTLIFSLRRNVVAIY